MNDVQGESQSQAAFPVDGRVAFVTGAGRGIGRGAAMALAEAGAEVVLMSRTGAELDEVAGEIRKRGGRAQPVIGDVTDAASIRDAISRLPRLDILVNNAGGNIPEPFVDVSDAHLDKLLALNVRGAFTTAQAAVRKMLETGDRKERGGAVINLSSQMGHVGAPRRTVYCMTKHAIEGLTKAMAIELAPQNIRVNSVAPTFIETPMTAGFLKDPAFLDWVMSRIPLGRSGKPRDVAGAIVFLASPAAHMITGTSLLVDGGWTAQ
jgi:NAD(P)-dependent dehydrogenase (short-subunit alcohol dehydrogenase family)